MKHLSGISWSINCYLIKIICYWLLPDLTLYTIQIFFLLFCLFSNTTCWRCGLYSIYVNKDLDMYERFLKIFVQMGSKWTHDFNRVYITFYFSICHFCSCRFCIKNKANTDALNIYYCFIPLLIYFVTTDLFQYYFLVPKNWLSLYGSPWVFSLEILKIFTVIVFKNVPWYTYWYNKSSKILRNTWVYLLCLCSLGKKIKKIHYLFKSDCFPAIENIPNLRKQWIFCYHTFSENKWTRKSLGIWILCTLKRDDALLIDFYISKAYVHKNANHQIENSKLGIKIWNMTLTLKLILCSIIKIY